MMKEKILIVEDEFIVAYDLQMILEKDGYEIIGIADSVKQAFAILEVKKPNLVLLDIHLKGKLTGIDLAKHLMKVGIPFIYISANSNEKILEAAKATQPYGFIVKPYRNNDVLLSVDIARYRSQYSTNFKLRGELYMKGMIERIFKSQLSREQKLMRIITAFQPYIPFDFVVVNGLDKEHKSYIEIGISRTNFEDYEVMSTTEYLKLAGISPNEYRNFHQLIPELTTEGIYIGNDFAGLRERSKRKDLMAKTFSFRSNLVKPFKLTNGEMFVFSFWSKIEDCYFQEHLDLLNHLSATLAADLPHIIDRKQFAVEAGSFSFLKDTKINFEGIIGSSTGLLQVLDQIKIVANTETSVLITGESGTGKERVAANLHQLSDRSSKPMITVNCAALPTDLIESILFGHEKGSFTGATDLRIGKFEEASGGTIFLDEIGEMPFELQSKLLRVLQEKEVERIGGRHPIAVDLRIIAATNRNLEREISNGRFRLDLYYRLNVFPIHLPPLRERRDDIPELADHFIAYHSKKLKKNISGFSASLFNDLMAYDWPGNIRELEHLIERSVLLTPGGTITENYLGVEISDVERPSKGSTIKTIAENEKEYIIEVLKKCSGKIAGEGGAAELLGIPPTTLNSKMKKLGIQR